MRELQDPKRRAWPRWVSSGDYLSATRNRAVRFQADSTRYNDLKAVLKTMIPSIALDIEQRSNLRWVRVFPPRVDKLVGGPHRQHKPLVRDSTIRHLKLLEGLL